MAFWDGQRWVAAATPAPATRSASRLKDWSATLVLFAMVGVAAVPFAGVSAASPQMVITPASAAPGTTVSVAGKGFSPRIKLQLTWDGSADAMPTASVSGRGAFKASFKTPSDDLGPHTIAAVQISGGGKGTKVSITLGAILASTVITLSASTPATAAPTPTPTSTAQPTAQPTPTPTPTLAPTPTPTPTPTVMPTATPTATPAPTSTATPTPSPIVPKLYFGLGTQVENARTTDIAKSSPVEIYSSWYNGSHDLGWMTDSWHRSIYQNIYASGHAIHLITWTELPETTVTTPYGPACGRAYPLSTRWLEDMRVLAQAFGGAADGPALYVTLFTEFQTYPCTDNAWNPDTAVNNYYRALKDQYRRGLEIFHTYAPNAKVSLGWGGWQSRWDNPSVGEGRSMIPYFGDVMTESDFVSFQARSGDDNVADIRSMTRILGAYGPVMLAHHMPDGDTNAGSTVDSTFASDVRTLLNDASVAALTADGLFGWALMHDGPLTRSSSLSDFVKAAIQRYGRS